MVKGTAYTTNKIKGNIYAHPSKSNEKQIVGVRNTEFFGITQQMVLIVY